MGSGLTRKHFEAIAAEINDSRKAGIGVAMGDTQLAWDAGIAYATIGIANALERTAGLDVNGNARFRRWTFYKATGLTRDDFERSGRNPQIDLTGF